MTLGFCPKSLFITIIWQERKDSNPNRADLESAVLPITPRPQMVVGDLSCVIRTPFYRLCRIVRLRTQQLHDLPGTSSQARTGTD